MTVYSRRKFMTHYFQSGAVLLGAGLIAEACTNKQSLQENKNAIDPCDDFSTIRESEMEKRKKFAYVKNTTDALKRCNQCKLYLPPKPDETCGGCMLFKGPVDGNGSCTYWAPLD